MTKAFGMKDTNKTEAKKLFKTVLKVLLPANEFFIKAMIALDEI